MPEPQSAAALRACAAGLYHAEAACELLIATSWPHRADFRDRFIHAAVSISDGTTAMASIDWAAAITALAGAQLPCSGAERRLLRLAASLGDGIPVDLRDALASLDPLTELPREAARFGGQPAGAVGTFPAHGHRRRVTQGPGIAGRSPRGFASGYRRPVGAVSAA